MFSKLFSIETKPGAFFRRIDWVAFWGATIIAFLVYFFTLGPSVGLEDSGELATAGGHRSNSGAVSGIADMVDHVDPPTVAAIGPWVPLT